MCVFVLFLYYFAFQGLGYYIVVQSRLVHPAKFLICYLFYCMRRVCKHCLCLVSSNVYLIVCIVMAGINDHIIIDAL